MRNKHSSHPENPKIGVQTILAATFGIAITFTLSCSSDNIGDGGGGSGSSNLSDLPTQAYLVYYEYDDDNSNIVKNKYEGSSDITLRIPFYTGFMCNGNVCTCIDRNGIEHPCSMDERDHYESKPAGRIQNGKVSLNLPNIDSKYLYKLEICDEYDTECNISIIPENFTIFTTGSFSITIDKSDYLLELFLTNLTNNRRAYFDYTSQSGKVTGTNGPSTNYDLNFSKGWNVHYRVKEGNDNYYTSDLSKTGGTLEWHITRDDD
jgi:hypothetical protein